MKPVTASLAAAILLVTSFGKTARGDEVEDQVEVLVTSLAGSLRRDENLESRPIYSINLNATKASDDDLKLIARLMELETLDLDKTSVTDVGITELNNLATLQSLSLKDTKVGDSAIKDIKRLPKLRNLYLKGTLMRYNRKLCSVRK